MHPITKLSLFKDFVDCKTQTLDPTLKFKTESEFEGALNAKVEELTKCLKRCEELKGYLQKETDNPANKAIISAFDRSSARLTLQRSDYLLFLSKSGAVNPQSIRLKEGAAQMEEQHAWKQATVALTNPERYVPQKQGLSISFYVTLAVLVGLLLLNRKISKPKEPEKKS